jgi:hypothetical protein
VKHSPKFQKKFLIVILDFPLKIQGAKYSNFPPKIFPIKYRITIVEILLELWAVAFIPIKFCNKYFLGPEEGAIQVPKRQFFDDFLDIFNQLEKF